MLEYHVLIDYIVLQIMYDVRHGFSTEKLIFTKRSCKSELLEHGLHDVLGATAAAQVRCQHCAFTDDLIDSLVDPTRAGGITKEAQHERRRADRSQRVGNPFALNVWRRTMNTTSVCTSTCVRARQQKEALTVRP